MIEMNELPLTVVILTLNEERNLPRCLQAIPPGIKVVIVDSGSTDNTVELAKSRGSTVIHNAWSGFAAQRNFAIHNCQIDSPWILFIDADEIYPAEFYRWAAHVLAADPPVDVYDVPSVLMMYGQPLKYAPGYPVLHPRLIRRETVVFVPNFSGHGEMTELCRRSVAPYGYDHHFFIGIAPWLAKHLALAKAEAHAAPAKPTTARGRVSRLVPRTLLRPVLRFFYHYIVRRGFLDGRLGLYYSVMYAWYELTIWLIRKESVFLPEQSKVTERMAGRGGR